MPKLTVDRKRRFRAAAALVGGYTKACAAIDYSANHVTAVLNGKIESPSVIAAVDAFIDEHLSAAAA